MHTAPPPPRRYIERTTGPDVFYVGENFVDLRWQDSNLEYNQDEGAVCSGTAAVPQQSCRLPPACCVRRAA